MSRVDYGIVDLEAVPAPIDPSGVGHAGLTDRLGCTEASVDAYRLEADAVTLPAGPEQVCVPDGPGGSIAGATSVSVAHPGLGFVPAGRGGALVSAEPLTWLVISTPGIDATDRDPMSFPMDEPTYEVPSSSDVAVARLTDDLGATGMKVNLRRLEADQAVPSHVEGHQEELFVPLTGPGRLRVGGRTHDLPRGAMARVAPETPRSVTNETDDLVIWAMVGAPPTGGADEWDPGSTIVE